MGNLPASSAQVYSSAAEATQFAFSARVHMALSEYRRELFVEATVRGWPVVRHMALQFPDAVAAAAAAAARRATGTGTMTHCLGKSSQLANGGAVDC